MRLASLARYLQAKPGPSQTTRWSRRATRRGLSPDEQRILDDAARTARAYIERAIKISTTPAAGVSGHGSRQVNHHPSDQP